MWPLGHVGHMTYSFINMLFISTGIFDDKLRLQILSVGTTANATLTLHFFYWSACTKPGQWAVMHVLRVYILPFFPVCFSNYLSVTVSVLNRVFNKIKIKIHIGWFDLQLFNLSQTCKCTTCTCSTKKCIKECECMYIT